MVAALSHDVTVQVLAHMCTICTCRSLLSLSIVSCLLPCDSSAWVVVMVTKPLTVSVAFLARCKRADIHFCISCCRQTSSWWSMVRLEVLATAWYSTNQLLPAEADSRSQHQRSALLHN